MDNFNILLFSLALILPTQLTRLIPLILESKAGRLISREDIRKRLNEIIFILLIGYCFRDTALTLEYGIRMTSAIIVFALQYRFEKTLVSIFIGTFLYMTGRNIL